jgi:hypothetical protein
MMVALPGYRPSIMRGAGPSKGLQMLALALPPRFVTKRIGTPEEDTISMFFEISSVTSIEIEAEFLASNPNDWIPQRCNC